MRFYLQNSNHECRGNTSKERATDAKLRNWTLLHFELQNNQIYRKAGIDSKSVVYNSKYAACDSDALNIIQSVDKTNHRIQQRYYGITEADVEWVRKACNICNQAAPPKSKKPPVYPIIPTGIMDELIVDLMDFTNEIDGNMSWIMHLKNPFAKFC
ncbi:hypothetical protein BDZ45DRAFT_696723 [Acephala macrosclerotiorum]|nr:hypothetical protein BDZ45DRAFT_696723 [Acephala macrosclerotiorum]